MLDPSGARRLFKQRQYTTLQPCRLTVHLTDLFLGSIGVPAIAGIAVSCVLLGILVTIIVFIYLRHKAKTLGEMQGPMDMTGQVKFDNNADNVGFSNPIYSTSDEPIKANPIYSSKDDRLDDVDDNPDYTAPY